MTGLPGDDQRPEGFQPTGLGQGRQRFNDFSLFHIFMIVELLGSLNDPETRAKLLVFVQRQPVRIIGKWPPSWRPCLGTADYSVRESGDTRGSPGRITPRHCRIDKDGLPLARTFGLRDPKPGDFRL